MWTMGRINLLLSKAYDGNVLTAVGRHKQCILLKAVLTAGFVTQSGVIADLYDIRNVISRAPFSRGRIKIGQGADLCSLVVEVC